MSEAEKPVKAIGSWRANSPLGSSILNGCRSKRPDIREQSYPTAKDRVVCKRGGVHIRTCDPWRDRPTHWLESTFRIRTSIGFGLPQKIYCNSAGGCWHSGLTMTYLLPPLNPLRAFEAC